MAMFTAPKVKVQATIGQVSGVICANPDTAKLLAPLTEIVPALLMLFTEETAPLELTKIAPLLGAFRTMLPLLVTLVTALELPELQVTPVQVNDPLLPVIPSRNPVGLPTKLIDELFVMVRI